MLRIEDCAEDLPLIAEHSALTLADALVIYAPRQHDFTRTFKKWLTEEELRALRQVRRKLDDELNPVAHEVMSTEKFSPLFNAVAFDIGVNRLREISGVDVAKVTGTFTEFKAALDAESSA